MTIASNTRSASKSAERLEPGEIEEGEDYTPPAIERGRDAPPHLTIPSSSRIPGPFAEVPAFSHPASSRSPSPTPSFEHILERQQQQFYDQQRLMMTSFQQMFATALAARTAPAANATGATAPPANLESKMRLKDPDTFDGSPRSCESFINSCVNIFLAQPHVYPDAATQVRFALSFLSGNATRWRDAMHRDLRLGSYVITSWGDFEQRFRMSFDNPHRVDEAKRKLHHIVQGHRTAEDFFLEFEDLRAEAGFCDSSVIFQLLRAIRRDVRDEAQRRRPKPEYYDEWKQTILQVDQDLRGSAAANAFYDPNARGQNHFQSGFAPRFQNTNRFGASTRYNSPSTPTPITPAAAPKAPTSTTATLPAPAVTSSSSGPHQNCWKCGLPGHYPRLCPNVGKATGKLTRQLFEKADELETQMEHVRNLLGQVDDLPEDTEEDHEVFIRLMEELPTFFVPNDG
jgi:hypothetical protein